MQKSEGIVEWLKRNAWAIIIFVGVTIAGYTTLNNRVDAMEKKLAQYPSQQYFDLKFQTIEDNVTDLKNDLKEHTRLTDK